MPCVNVINTEEDQSSSWSFEGALVPLVVVLGPDRFLLYINDRLSGLSCDEVMFADDGQWRVHLMFNVCKIQSCSQGALMSFNTDKCVVLRLHPRQARDNNVQYQLNWISFLTSYSSSISWIVRA